MSPSGLTGRLPAAVETLDEQAVRVYAQMHGYETDLEKYIYLDQLHDRNEVLFYRRPGPGPGSGQRAGERGCVIWPVRIRG